MKMQKLFQKFFSLIFLLVLFLPVVSLAGLKLEQNYPVIPGIVDSGQSLNNITQESNATNKAVNVASLVKYFTDLAFILTVGLATLSLIIAGVQYFSSSGNAGGMRTARTRAGKSFLGISIIVLSYLILQLIMPQVNIPTLTRVGGFEDSNIILFSEEGYNDLVGTINKDSLDELVNSGKAKYASSQSVDLTTSFGRLIKFEDDAGLSFEDLTPRYIGFYGVGKENIELKAFSGKGFLGTQITYTSKGVKNANGDLDSSTVMSFGTSIDLKTVKLRPFTTPISYFDVTNLKELVSGKIIAHPLLSFSVQGIGAGVYLYGSDQPVAIETGETNYVVGDVDMGNYIEYIKGKGGQRYLQMSYPDFSSQTFDFDNQAIKIEIKNKEKNDQDPTEQNLLAVLFEDTFYRGKFRIFLEKQNLVNLFPKIYYDNTLKKKGFDIDVVKDSPIYFDKGKGTFETEGGLMVGNIEKPVEVTSVVKKTDVNGTDQFGTVGGASSAGILELAPFENNECEEVIICNDIKLDGYCISFTPNGKDTQDAQTFTLPMPWFVPVAIPEKLKGAIIEYKDAIGALEKDNNNEFADNIRSIGIAGKCAVALFENTVKMDRILPCTAGTEKNCWDNGGPGVNSQIFTQADMVSNRTDKGRMRYLDLENQPIGSCTKRTWHLSLRRVPCASSIAIYPIK